jgi:hypothetical protein
MTIIENPQRTKIYVLKKATIQDLIKGNTYLIGIDGGHSSAKFLKSVDGKHFFDYRGEIVSVSSMDSVYVI